MLSGALNIEIYLQYHFVVKSIFIILHCILLLFIAVMHWYKSTQIFGVTFLFDNLSGAWNMKDRALYQGTTIKSWGLLVYGGRFPGYKIDHFKACLKGAA